MVPVKGKELWHLHMYIRYTCLKDAAGALYTTKAQRQGESQQAKGKPPVKM